MCVCVSSRCACVCVLEVCVCVCVCVSGVCVGACVRLCVYVCVRCVCLVCVLNPVPPALPLSGFKDRVAAAGGDRKDSGREEDRRLEDGILCLIYYFL